MRASIALVLALAACGSDGPRDRVAVTIAPLGLDDVEDVEYRLTVSAGAQLWQETFHATMFGDGRSASFVGPCEAGVSNVVGLEILEIVAGGRVLVDGTDYRNPAPDGAPITQSVMCVANADSPVRFDLTIARAATQGFFDIAVAFDDVFCSAKLDCTKADGSPNLLLFAPGTETRIPTAVMGFACTGGVGGDTYLWFDRPRLVCGGVTYELPLDRDAVGNVYATNPDGPIAQVGIYRGVETVQSNGVPAAELYANAAFALDPLGAGVTCELHAAATASDRLFANRTTPLGTYPLVRWDVVPVADATGFVCGQQKMDALGSGVRTAYTQSESFDFGLTEDDGTLIVLRGAVSCGDAICDAGETAAGCPEDCLAVCPVGMWGARCDQACAVGNCASDVVCNRTTGVVESCGACGSGWWGSVCASACAPGDCTAGISCDQDTGALSACSACAPGFTGPTCTGTCPAGQCDGAVTCDQSGAMLTCSSCADGWWGSVCASVCAPGDCTAGISCDQDTGALSACSACAPGFTGPTCASACPAGQCDGAVTCDQSGAMLTCSSCADGWWGSVCASACAPGNCTAGVACDQGTGALSACSACAPGFTGPTCASACPAGHCDGSVTCDQAGVMQTCSSCADGFYGPTCASTCNPGNCSAGVACDQTSGTLTACGACAPGFTGPTCTSSCPTGHCDGAIACDQSGSMLTCSSCDDGFTGPTCASACTNAQCTAGIVCDQATGTTTSCSACAAGRTGPTCAATCPAGHCEGTITCTQSGTTLTCGGCADGWWGATCTNACSNANCASGILCDEVTGQTTACSTCAPGRSGPTCETYWYDDTFTRRAPLNISLTSAPPGATSVQVPVDVDALCYGTKLPPILYSYHFEEGNGATRVDSRDGHAGFAPLNGNTFAAGMEGQSLGFSGSQYVDVPDIVPSTNTLTLAFWMKFNTLPANMPAVVSAWSNVSGGGGEVYVVYAVQSGQCSPSRGAGVHLMAKVHPVSQTEHNKCSAAIADNTWVHVALTYNRRFEKLYINGVEDQSHDYGSVSTLEATSAVRFGVERSLAQFFKGSLDDVALFDGVMDDTDVAALMSPKCRKDLADLRFHDDTNDTILPHWIESDRRVWVKVPIASIGHTMNVYFGNANATSTSNGAATFDAFEDFEDALDSNWTLAAGCSSSTLPTLQYGKLKTVTDCATLTSSASFDSQRRTVALDVFRDGTDSAFSCYDVRSGWLGQALGLVLFNSPNDIVALGNPSACAATTPNIAGASFDLGTLGLSQAPTSDDYAVTWNNVHDLTATTSTSVGAGAKGNLRVQVAGQTNTPRWLDNVRVLSPATATATLGPSCTQSTCLGYKWVDLGARTLPVSTATSCNTTAAQQATCNATNLGKRVHISNVASPFAMSLGLVTNPIIGSYQGGAGTSYTLAPNAVTLDWSGPSGTCSGQTSTVVTLPHVFECQLTP